MPKATASNHAQAATDDLRRLLAEAEKALAATGDSASEEIKHLRERLRDALDDGRAFARHVTTLAREQAARADEFVHERPYVAMGVAAGVGAMIGVLLARRCGD